MAEESAGGSVNISEHVNIAVVLLILIALFVYGFGAVGRHVGNKTNSPGVTAYFGG
jgi:hypothetical protein